MSPTKPSGDLTNKGRKESLQKRRQRANQGKHSKKNGDGEDARRCFQQLTRVNIPSHHVNDDNKKRNVSDRSGCLRHVPAFGDRPKTENAKAFLRTRQTKIKYPQNISSWTSLPLLRRLLGCRCPSLNRWQDHSFTAQEFALFLVLVGNLEHRAVETSAFRAGFRCKMSVTGVNLSSDGEDCTHLRKMRKRHLVSPTVKTPKSRHACSTSCEGNRSKLDEADEDYLPLLDLQRSSDSDVCSLKEEEGVNHAADDISDSHYNIFLENLKIEYKTYALQIELEGSMEFLRYECEEMPCSKVNKKVFENRQDNSKKERSHGTCILQKTRNGRHNTVDTFRNKDSKKQSNRINKSIKIDSDDIQMKVKIKHRKGVLQRKNVDVEVNSTKMKRGRVKACGKSVHLRNVHDRAEDAVAWEQNILAFVRHLRKDGDFIVRTFDAGTTIRYGEYQEDIQSDVEIIERDKISSIGLNNPFVSARSSDVVNLEGTGGGKNASSNDSEFRINLLKKLKEPYDMKEYEDLLKMVTYKRRKEVDKELRGGRGLSYSMKSVRKSYLDIYKDFVKVLKRAKGDRSRTLNLLRGFQYWLHNVPKEGSFYPWLDLQCLSLLPGS
ncbi:hypothetical protein MLD38_001942 [Melastoma candidum]|uniref:Uncharacterized protein n=1 Tax=Melastoma candidum TaxID=119954 RepID=A0ACB9SFT7_9MYRT|nr:hypothetical protein MLD38_001942 [Melastoma candidum]